MNQSVAGAPKECLSLALFASSTVIPARRQRRAFGQLPLGWYELLGEFVRG